jgi:hypothetical protein
VPEEDPGSGGLDKDKLANVHVSPPRRAERSEGWTGWLVRLPLRAVSLIPPLRESRLSSLLEEDDLAWTAEDAEVKSLVGMLRAKHAQSRLDVHAANRLGTIAAIVGAVGVLAAVFIAYTAWEAIRKALESGKSVDWHLLVATSGAVLLILASATLALRVADRFYQRALAHARDADATRRIEASIRIALVARHSPEHTREMLCTLAGKIISHAGARDSEEKLDLSVTPELAREGIDLAGKVLDTAKTSIK